MALPGTASHSDLTDYLVKASQQLKNLDSSLTNTAEPSIARGDSRERSYSTTKTSLNVDETTNPSIRESLVSAGLESKATDPRTKRFETRTSISTHTMIPLSNSKGKDKEEENEWPLKSNFVKKNNHSESLSTESIDVEEQKSHEVIRDWQRNLVASRGPYDAKGFGRYKRFLHNMRTLGETTLPLKKAIQNAVKTAILFKELAEALVAVAVHKNWLPSSFCKPDVPTELILQIQHKLEAHYKQPRKGDFTQMTVCQLARVVMWMADEIQDDLWALGASYRASDPIRADVFRSHFAKDWARTPPIVFGGFTFTFKSGSNRMSLTKCPLSAVCYGKAQIDQKQIRKARKNTNYGDVNEQSVEIVEKAKALTKFWFAGLHIHTSIRKARETHTVHSCQPKPYENVESLKRLSFQQRVDLKDRCLSVYRAILYNLDLLCAEFSTNHWSKSIESSESQPSTRSSALISSNSQIQIELDQSARNIRRLHKRYLKEERTRRQKANTHLRKIQEALKVDAEAIHGLFNEDTISTLDVDILLFYENLRSHAWNGRWYGCNSTVIAIEVQKNPSKVMRKALNMGVAPLEQQ